MLVFGRRALHRPAFHFLPRAATELILQAHDVCLGLQVPFEPPAEMCLRLREHTRPWPMWTLGWDGLDQTDDGTICCEAPAVGVRADGR